MSDRGKRVTRIENLTNEQRKTLLDAIKAGVSAISACSLSGVRNSTFYAWRKKGREDTRGLYFDFNNQVEEAIAHSEATLVAKVRNATILDWRASAWMLERRFPETWGRSNAEIAAIHRALSDIFLFLAQQASTNVYSEVMGILAAKLPPQIIDVLPVPIIAEGEGSADFSNVPTDQLLKMVNHHQWS